LNKWALSIQFSNKQAFSEFSVQQQQEGTNLPFSAKKVFLFFSNLSILQFLLICASLSYFFVQSFCTKIAAIVSRIFKTQFK
jgi:proline dehydrogenase